MKYSTADLINGILETFESREDAEKSLAILISEGNAINESNRAEYEDAGQDVPKAEDFYSVVVVNDDDDSVI